MLIKNVLRILWSKLTGKKVFVGYGVTTNSEVHVDSIELTNIDEFVHYVNPALGAFKIIVCRLDKNSNNCYTVQHKETKTVFTLNEEVFNLLFKWAPEKPELRLVKKD